MYTFLNIHNINTSDMVFYLDPVLMWFKHSSLHLQASLFLDLDSQSEYTNDQSSAGSSCRKVQRTCFGRRYLQQYKYLPKFDRIQIFFFLCCNKNKVHRWRFPDRRPSLGKLKWLGKLKVDLCRRGGTSPWCSAREQTNSLSVDENLNLAVIDSVVAPVAVLRTRTFTMQVQMSHQWV